MRLLRPAALAGALTWLVLGTAVGAAAETTTVDLGGAEPDGTLTDRSDPAVVGPGVWADTLGQPGTGEDVHYFRYERRIKDSTVHVGVIGAPRGTSNDGIGLEVTAGDTTCGTASGTASSSSTVPQTPIGLGVSVGGSDAEERDAECLVADTLDIAVDRGYATSLETDLPIALKIVEEAPVASVGDLPAAAEDESFTPVGPDDAEDAGDLAGATSLDAAPELDPVADGVAVRATLTPGEVRIWRVPVGWGRQLSTVLDVPAYDDGDPDTSFSGPYVDLRVIDPLRRVVQNTETVDEEGTSSSGSVSEDEDLRLGVGTAPVRYLHRYDSVDATVPGEHWVAVSVQPDDESGDGSGDGSGEDAEPLEIPFELTVAVTGEEDPPPLYADQVLGAGGREAPSDYDPATPFLIGADTFSATAGDLADDGGWWSPRRYGALGLAVLSLACCGAGVWQLRRR